MPNIIKFNKITDYTKCICVGRIYIKLETVVTTTGMFNAYDVESRTLTHINEQTPVTLSGGNIDSLVPLVKIGGNKVLPLAEHYTLKFEQGREPITGIYLGSKRGYTSKPLLAVPQEIGKRHLHTTPSRRQSAGGIVLT